MAGWLHNKTANKQAHCPASEENVRLNTKGTWNSSAWTPKHVKKYKQKKIQLLKSGLEKSHCPWVAANGNQHRWQVWRASAEPCTTLTNAPFTMHTQAASPPGAADVTATQSHSDPSHWLRHQLELPYWLPTAPSMRAWLDVKPVRVCFSQKGEGTFTLRFSIWMP